MKWILLCATAFTIPLTAKMTDEAKCPEPDLFKKNAQIFSGSAEFIFWQVAEGCLDYALKMKQDAWGPSDSYAQGQSHAAQYNFDPGFRLSLVYFRAPHYWESRWQYTYLSSAGHNRVGKPSASGRYVTGTWPQITTAPLSGARSDIHFNYNVFDWMVDRVFIPNPHLRLRVLGGLVATWMEQNWKIRYTDSTPNTTSIHNRWEFIGGGLKTGTMVDWYWTGDLYMTAVGTFGVLMGSYSNQAKQTTTYQPLPADNTSIPIRDVSFHQARPTFTAQMLLGPSWQKNYPKNRVELFAGFEMNVWFNLQEVYRSTAGGPFAAKETWINSSALALYGLTTRVTVDF